MAYMTIFRQDLHADDIIIEDETELLQSYLSANTPMGLRAVVILDRADRSASVASSIASPVNTTTALRKSTGGTAPRKTNLASALSNLNSVAVRLQQRQKVDKKKDATLSDVLPQSIDDFKDSLETTPSQSHGRTNAHGRYGDSLTLAHDTSPASNRSNSITSIANEDKIIEQATKIYYFYNMDLTKEHVHQIIRDFNLEADDVREREILQQCDDLRAKYEEKIWGDFKSFRTGAHLSNVYDILYGDDDDENREDPNTVDERYSQLTELSKWEFWFSQYTISTGFAFLEPLKKAIRREEALRNPQWGNYVRKIWTAACISTWENHIQYNTEADKHLIDREQIRQDIREAAGRYCADRPPIEDVPIHFGGIREMGPRKKRDEEVDEMDPDWFDDENFGPPEDID